MKTLKNSIMIINTIFLVWLGVSFIEVLAKNLDNPNYNPFNLFVLLINLLQ